MAEMQTQQDITQFYDKWVPKQVHVGVNLRHRTIFRLLKREGLRRGDRVLEIGCGIGAVTGLVANYLKTGSMVAVDISPKSIEQARHWLARQRNVEFKISDMSDFESELRFDVIFLPDVLEHIPVEQHAALFKTIKGVLKDSGFVLIHIPNPRYLDWVRIKHPEQLQIIDQSLHTYPLLKDIHAAGLYLHRLGSHSIFNDPADYQVLILRSEAAESSYRPVGKYPLYLRGLLARLLY